MRDAALRPARPAALACFFFVLLVTAAYQACYCWIVSGGDITALFFVGGAAPRPPELSGGFSYSGSRGYDGQLYRILAHDPLLRKGYGIDLDDPRYRSRRILIPALAALLGAGSPVVVDFWYVGVTDILIAFGAVCFVFLAFPCCRPAATAVLYLFIPAIVASTDRMVLDGPAVAGFLAAWLFLRDRRFVPLLIVLTALPLLRETNLCVTAGCFCVLLWSRDYRRAVFSVVTVFPTRYGGGSWLPALRHRARAQSWRRFLCCRSSCVCLRPFTGRCPRWRISSSSLSMRLPACACYSRSCGWPKRPLKRAGTLAVCTMTLSLSCRLLFWRPLPEAVKS